MVCVDACVYFLGEVAMAYVKYNHHGKDVWVHTELRGKHRDHCLCFQCSKFKPDNRAENCPIANKVYANCVQYNIVSPVWECPDFVPNIPTEGGNVGR